MNEVTKQQIRTYKIDKARLVRGSKQSMYLTRQSNPKTMKFRSDLGFHQINLKLKKEQSVVIPLLKAFSAEKIKLYPKILENKRVRSDM